MTAKVHRLHPQTATPAQKQKGKRQKTRDAARDWERIARDHIQEHPEWESEFKEFVRVYVLPHPMITDDISQEARKSLPDNRYAQQPPMVTSAVVGQVMGRREATQEVVSTPPTQGSRKSKTYSMNPNWKNGALSPSAKKAKRTMQASSPSTTQPSQFASQVDLNRVETKVDKLAEGLDKLVKQLGG